MEENKKIRHSEKLLGTVKLKIIWNKTLSPFSLAPRNPVTFFQVLYVLNYQFKGENIHLLFLTPSFAQQPFT